MDSKSFVGRFVQARPHTRRSQGMPPPARTAKGPRHRPLDPGTVGVADAVGRRSERRSGLDGTRSGSHRGQRDRYGDGGHREHRHPPHGAHRTDRGKQRRHLADDGYFGRDACVGAAGRPARILVDPHGGVQPARSQHRLRWERPKQCRVWRRRGHGWFVPQQRPGRHLDSTRPPPTARTDDPPCRSNRVSRPANQSGSGSDRGLRRE